MGDSDLVSKSGSSSSSSISELRLWEATTVLHTRTADLLQRADSDLAEPDLADPPDWRSSISAEQLARLSPTFISSLSQFHFHVLTFTFTLG